ncbi:MAG: hypothetical protein ROR55_20875 [Devosia sp.]
MNRRYLLVQALVFFGTTIVSVPSMAEGPSVANQGQPLDAVFILKVIANSGAIVTLIIGAYIVFYRIKNNQEISTGFVQLVVLLVFLPVVAIVTLSNALNGEALSALLGTIAGYVLGSFAAKHRIYGLDESAEQIGRGKPDVAAAAEAGAKKEARADSIYSQS